MASLGPVGGDFMEYVERLVGPVTVVSDRS